MRRVFSRARLRASETGWRALAAAGRVLELCFGAKSGAWALLWAHLGMIGYAAVLGFLTDWGVLDPAGRAPAWATGWLTRGGGSFLATAGNYGLVVVVASASAMSLTICMSLRSLAKSLSRRGARASLERAKEAGSQATALLEAEQIAAETKSASSARRSPARRL